MGVAAEAEITVSGRDVQVGFFEQEAEELVLAGVGGETVSEFLPVGGESVTAVRSNKSKLILMSSDVRPEGIFSGGRLELEPAMEMLSAKL